MNYLDIVVVLILIFFLLKGMREGFVKNCLGLFPLIGALVLTNKLYPVLSRLIRSTPIYKYLQSNVYEGIGLDTTNLLLNGDTSHSKAIEGLDLPNFLKKGLVENNNSVVYNILGVEDFGEYIASYIANACINALCVILVFFVLFISIKIVIGVLGLVTKMPILNFFNKALGTFSGLVQGILFVWIIGLVLVFFYSNPAFGSFFDTLYKSNIAMLFYENNLLMLMVLRIMV